MNRLGSVEFEGVIGRLEFTYEETEKQLDRLFTPVNEFFIVDMSSNELYINTRVDGSTVSLITVKQIKEQGMRFGIHIEEAYYDEDSGMSTLWEKTLKVLDEKSFYQTIKNNCSVFKQQVAFG